MERCVTKWVERRGEAGGQTGGKTGRSRKAVESGVASCLRAIAGTDASLCIQPKKTVRRLGVCTCTCIYVCTVGGWEQKPPATNLVQQKSSNQSLCVTVCLFRRREMRR